MGLGLVAAMALVSSMSTAVPAAAASSDGSASPLPTLQNTPGRIPVVCLLSTRPGDAGRSSTNVWSDLCDFPNEAASGAPRSLDHEVSATAPGEAGERLAGCLEVTAQDRCEAWAVRYDSGPDSHGLGWGVGDQLADVATSPDGDRVFVTGQVPDATTQAWKAATVAYDSNGELLWVAHFAGRHGAAAAAIAISSDGSTVFVIGGSANKDRTVFVMTAVAYDAATGEELWAAENGSKAGGAAVALSPTGGELYVTGPEAVGDGQNIDFATAAFDTSTGALLWSTRHDATDASSGSAVAPSVDRPLHIYSTGDRIYVGGESTSVRDGQTTIAVVAAAYDTGEAVSSTDPVGPDPLWTNRYAPSESDRRLLGGDFPPVMRISPDGSRLFWLATVTARDGSDLNAVVIAYDAAHGNQEWAEAYPTESLGWDLAISPDGERAYFTGLAFARFLPLAIPNTQEIKLLTTAYDSSTGDQLWSQDYGHAGLDEGFAIAVSPDGQHVYVAGRSAVPNAGAFYWLHGLFDLVTLEYAATSGQQEWAARFGTGDYQRINPKRLSVSPDGQRLYIGATEHPREPDPYLAGPAEALDQRIGNWSDYLMVAYDLKNG